MERIPLQRNELPDRIAYIFQNMLNGMIHPSIPAQVFHGIFLAVRITTFMAWITTAVLFNREWLNTDYCGVVNLIFLVLSLTLMSLDQRLKDLLGMINPLAYFKTEYFIVNCSMDELVKELERNAYAYALYTPAFQAESQESINILLKSVKAAKHPLYIQEFTNPIKTDEKVFHIVDTFMTKPLRLVKDEKTGDLHIYEI